MNIKLTINEKNNENENFHAVKFRSHSSFLVFFTFLEKNMRMHHLITFHSFTSQLVFTNHYKKVALLKLVKCIFHLFNKLDTVSALILADELF